MRLLLAIALTGSCVGLVGALFLMALQSADTARVALISLSEKSSFPSWLAGVLVSLAAASLAAWLASRFAPDTPQTAEARTGKAPDHPTSEFASLSANFAGTSLAIGAGLALGPERPAIQMGAAIGKTISCVVGLSPHLHNEVVQGTHPN